MNNSLFSLDGKVALIAGGNSGLGRAIAMGFRDIPIAQATTLLQTGLRGVATDSLGRLAV